MRRRQTVVLFLIHEIKPNAKINQRSEIHNLEVNDCVYCSSGSIFANNNMSNLHTPVNFKCRCLGHMVSQRILNNTHFHKMKSVYSTAITTIGTTPTGKKKNTWTSSLVANQSHRFRSHFPPKNSEHVFVFFFLVFLSSCDEKMLTIVKTTCPKKL